MARSDKVVHRPSTSGSPGPRIDPDRPPDPHVVQLQREPNVLRRLLSVAGPGFLTGASDDDPSGIGTYVQAGAGFGYATLWTMLLTLPLMVAVQFIAAKIGLVSGEGLSGVLNRHYARGFLWSALIGLVIANTINAGADIGAMAASASLLVPLPEIVFVVPIGLGLALVVLLGSYAAIVRIFKWLTLALLAFVAASVFAHPDIGQAVTGTLIPTVRFDPAFLGIVLALLGTTISPYLFFWQSSQEVAEQIEFGRRRLWQRQGATKPELRLAFWDTFAGMAFSQLVAYFVIVTSAATLYASGHRDVQSATQAAQALGPLAGDFASALLAIGLIGAGALSVPILVGSAAQALAEAFRWRGSFNEKPSSAPRFYLFIVLSTAAAVAMNFIPGVNPITALVFAAIVNGLLAAPLLIFLMLASNDVRVVGERTNGRLLNVVGWIAAAVMCLAAAGTILTTVLG